MFVLKQERFHKDWVTVSPKSDCRVFLVLGLGSEWSKDGTVLNQQQGQRSPIMSMRAYERTGLLSDRRCPGLSC